MPTDPTSQAALTTRQGQRLVALARDTLAAHFEKRHADPGKDSPDSRFTDPVYQASCGVFVTLKIRGALRGCIGTLTGHEPLVAGVRSNAVNAAFNDPRFRPLTRSELDRAAIEVSVLTPPHPMEYSDAADLLVKLRPGVDGVTIRKDSASATFLPQVWEQLPEKDRFLEHLCRKAGLAADAWLHGDLDVETYQVQYFAESE